MHANTREVLAALSLFILTFVLVACSSGSSSPDASREVVVAPDGWSEAIEALDPVSVCTHNNNTVVVLEVVDGVEYGKYIIEPESSYNPQLGDDGFTFNSGPVESPEFGGGMRSTSSKEPATSGGANPRFQPTRAHARLKMQPLVRG